MVICDCRMRGVKRARGQSAKLVARAIFAVAAEHFSTRLICLGPAPFFAIDRHCSSCSPFHARGLPDRLPSARADPCPACFSHWPSPHGTPLGPAWTAAGIWRQRSLHSCQCSTRWPQCLCHRGSGPAESASRRRSSGETGPNRPLLPCPLPAGLLSAPASPGAAGSGRAGNVGEGQVVPHPLPGQVAHLSLQVLAIVSALLPRG